MKQALVDLSNLNSKVICTVFEQLAGADLTAATKFLVLLEVTFYYCSDNFPFIKILHFPVNYNVN